MDIYRLINRRRTAQSQPATADQVRNDAGGYSFELDDIAKVRRFLVLGTDAGSYYQRAAELTRDNAECVLDLAERDGGALVDQIVDVSARGLAPRQNPALFALAIAASVGSEESKAYALSTLPRVARTGTHLFLFARYVEQFRGWGRGLRRAIGGWYVEKPVERLAYQVVKYRQREGWSHRDLLRLAHPTTTQLDRRALFDWIAHDSHAGLPRLVEGFARARSGADPAACVREYGLGWEMLPTESLRRRDVWDALLDQGLPQTALLRQLPRLTELGLLAPMSGGRTAEVCAQLVDPERLRGARVHPLAVLTAMHVYRAGRGKGSRWQPVAEVVDALDEAFRSAFAAVEPAGRRTLLGLDVSASMGWAKDASGILSAREVGAALALVIAATEPRVGVFGFTAASPGAAGGPAAAFQPLGFTGRERIDDAVRLTSDLPFGGTDCALPMTEALRYGWPVDTFVVITDNETWAGPVHPHQALVEYRRQTGIPAKLVVLAVTPTPFTIADPSDGGMLDVVGFGADSPHLVSAFSRGW